MNIEEEKQTFLKLAKFRQELIKKIETDYYMLEQENKE